MEIPMILPFGDARFTEFPLDLDHPHPAAVRKFGMALRELQKLENGGKTHRKIHGRSQFQ